MKLKTEKKEFENLGVESKTFSVDTNDTMIIKLLRDKMYKNKIGAVCREVVSNSRDANREAGRESTPVCVELTNNLGSLLSDEETYITFQDNGIGISPSRMDNIFLKYGGSTKRDSDKYTGGFGIGAKTPFAYSNEFVIITVVEEEGLRRKYEYQAVITSNGKSEVSRMMLLGSEVTDEQTGTKVCVPIKQEDRSEFEKELVYVTTLWKVRPVLKGFTEETTITILKETKDYIFIKDSSGRDNRSMFGSQTFIALIDEIPYKLEKDKLTNYKELEEISEKIEDRYKLVLKYNTGEVSVSGSREDVEYVNDNYEKFVEKAKIVLKEGEEFIESFLNSASSYVQSCVYSNFICKNRGYNYGNSQELVEGWNVDYLKYLSKLSAIKSLNYNDDKLYKEFNGVKSIEYFSPKTYNIYSMSIQNGRLTKGYSNRHTEISSKWAEEEYYLMDLVKAEPTRNAMLKQNFPSGYNIVEELEVENLNDYQVSLVQLSRADLFSKLRKEEDKMLELLGIKFKLYSEVEKLRKEKLSGKNITDIVSVSTRFRKNNTGYRNDDWAGLSIKFDKGSNVFLDLQTQLDSLIVDDSIANLRKVAYYEKEKLSDFNDTRVGGYNNVPGMTPKENSIRQILESFGFLVLGISTKTKTSYFEKTNIKSMKEVFAEILEGESGYKMKNALKFTLLKSLNLDLPILSEINMEAKVKNSFKDLKLEIDTINTSQKDDLILKDTIKLLKESKLNTEFIEEYKIDLGTIFKNRFETFEKFIENNKMLSFIIEVQSSTNAYGSNFNKNNKNFISGVDSFIELFNKVK
tara:strand:+ start:9259 stop:11667 length:2409 start_codon:yes stop_codon:yes gene_type:complete